MITKNKGRCAWPADDALMIKYHDEEWGIPVHDDRKLFEFITLDAFQAGLSWKTILHKREAFARAFANFDPILVSKFTTADVERLQEDKGIIRNKSKIRATVTNALSFLAVREEFGTFDKYIWQFVEYRTLVTGRRPGQSPLAASPESGAMSKDLYKRGFKFVGPVICYAFMQAAGMINDHVVTCFRHQEINDILNKKR